VEKRKPREGVTDPKEGGKAGKKRPRTLSERSRLARHLTKRSQERREVRRIYLTEMKKIRQREGEGGSILGKKTS